MNAGLKKSLSGRGMVFMEFRTNGQLERIGRVPPVCGIRQTRPPAYFQRNPPGRGRLAVFPSGGCRTRPVWIQIRALYRRSGSDRLEKQPTDPATAGRRHHYMRDGTLVCPKPIGHLQQLLEYSRRGAPDIHSFVAKVINDARPSLRFELCRETIRVEKR